jgi:TetR/AcrR family transcriptional regulator
MTEQELGNTEEKILDAAREVFTHKGMDGARMQEIAEKANINKALLHYYYRTKEKLFAAVFAQVFKIMLSRIDKVLDSDMPLFEKIELFVSTYIDVIRKNPFIPMFVLHELHKNPDAIANLFKPIGARPLHIFSQIEQAIEKGEIIPIAPQHLIVNLIGLCIFPVIGRPILQGILFNSDKKAYEKFLDERKEIVTKFILDSITVK